jgi:hypothetical protein
MNGSEGTGIKRLTKILQARFIFEGGNGGLTHPTYLVGSADYFC